MNRVIAIASLLAALALGAPAYADDSGEDGATSGTRTRSLGDPGTVNSTTDAPAPVTADSCLSQREVIDAVSDGRAVTLASASKVAQGAWSGQMIDAKLCNGSKGLNYVVTLLARDGKVARAWIDAATGRLLNVR